MGDFMVEKGKLKIKVLKKMSTEEVFGANPPLGRAAEVCGQFQVARAF